MRGYGMMMGSPMMGSPMQRHRQARMTGLPAAYRGLRNPLSADARVISQGGALYRADCAACHGNTGGGNGPAAVGMSPPPANLRWLMRRPIASDSYLMWALSEGGATLGTAMPAFKDALSENERWKIIRYLETLR
jgi:mono/diheme cytochrome c family protein